MLLVLIWWVVDAHKWFKGPKVNIQHQMIGAPGNVIDAKDASSDSGNDTAPALKSKDIEADKLV